ncbi:LptA/OstA family protein [Palleronia sp. LCG004]|uniref:LptA/OstA family protein n=1 Tax=Palleronia sp. LCG004 TaxID=3079304 RepID=UPI002942BE46|nr:LptA/OstA family protein [Palleronia sp. LCG004]WOI57628.1 LptA/OstA family protein [Palleronia sp. LCG004]
MAGLLFGAFLSISAVPGLAQGTAIEFGGLRQDTSLPVEITSDALQVSQSDGSATFTGNVLVSQGEMRLSAQEMRVVYAAGGASSGTIQELRATGGVTLVNGGDAAEAEEAVYDIEAGEVVMRGDVILTQGPNALSSNELTIDLASGTGRLQGGVRTIFQTGTR